MLIKVFLILLGSSMILSSRIEKTHVESEVEPFTHPDDVYGPKPQFPQKKLPSEEIKPTPPDTQDDLGKMAEATKILDSILKKSDYKLRPGMGEKPTEVTVELFINNFGPISIKNMRYSIDITLHQTWYDERLRYNGSFKSFVLYGNEINKLWVPDTFCRNSMKIDVHSITTHNKMVRIYKDGKVLFTDRMIIDAACSFHIFKYPMDSHSCPLSFSSFSYPKTEIIYKWEDFKIEINEDNSWKLFQFDFTGVSNETGTMSTIAGDFTVLTLFFNVTRQFSFNMFQNYIPSSMTTVMSWVSFWIQKESASARTSLGITSVLTITTLGSCTQENFSHESYLTLLDIYTAICFFFCFCALLEFAVLNFVIHTRPSASPRLRYPPTHTRDLTPPRIQGERQQRQQPQQQEDIFVFDFEGTDENDEEDGPSLPAQQSLNPNLTPPHIRGERQQRQQQEDIFVFDFEGTDENDEEDGPSLPAQQSLNPNLTPPRIQGERQQRQQQENIFVFDFEGTDENDEEDGPSLPAQQFLNQNLTQRHHSCCRICKYLCVVSSCDGSFCLKNGLFIYIYRLDNYSRVLFPVFFFIANVIYWVVFFNL